MEQRNGRIDRKLQRSPVVHCYYFVLAQRTEDKVLKVLVKKTETIQKELGTLSPVVQKNLSRLLEGGIRHNQVNSITVSIEQADLPNLSVINEELEENRLRKEELTKELSQLQEMLKTSRDWLGLSDEHFRNAISASLEILGTTPLAPVDSQEAWQDSATARWTLPPLDQRADPTWANTLDTLRPPRKKGHLTFPVQAMCEVSGRLILGAMQMLLEEQRVFNAPTDRRLVALLQNSRKYQNEVSTKLSEQVVDALWELLRGFQTANATANGLLLDDIAQNDPQHIYGGLITVLLRLVFLLYAEDEGLMPQGSIYTRNYSVTGLYERLREDAGNYPDTMEQRYGAWAWLLSLFRLVYDGGCHADLYLPARHGQVFDPDEYAFLEGRSRNTTYKEWELIEPPRISDSVVHEVLRGLLVLDGERLSYRALDVEQIGSVYSAIMGYEVNNATSKSIGVWSKPKGAKTSVTVVVSVDEVLNIKANDRAKYLKEVAGCEMSGKSLTELKQVKTAEDLIAALGRKISPQTPALLTAGSLYLQPGEERRRSGSHYTPRAYCRGKSQA